MASLYKQPTSAYWYIAYKKDGKWVRKSTELRWDDPDQTAKARAFRAEFEAAEFAAANRPNPAHHWDWVDAYFSSLSIIANTKVYYMIRWKRLSLFLQQNRLSERDVRYSTGLTYLEWALHKKNPKEKGLKKNNAQADIKLLSQILTEATRREIITANPLAKFQYKTEPHAKKNAFSDAEITKCLTHLQSKPAWMLSSFLIALYTGCRLQETQIPMTCIDLESTPKTITFPHPKGGASKSFSVPMPSALIPLFTKLKAEGAARTCAMPKEPSNMFRRFFDSIGLGHLTFHGLRVTKVTRLRREGIPREVAMRLVNHSSQIVHLLYDRHEVRDLAAFADSGAPALGSSCAIVQSPTKTPDLQSLGNP